MLETKENIRETKDSLMGVLTWIDSPFKLFVVLLLGILGYVGYFIYENKNFLFNVYEKSSAQPKIQSVRFDQVIELLMKDPNVLVVSLMSVDPIFNKRVILRVENRDGKRAKQLEGTNIGLFTTSSSNNADVVELMAGNIPCGFYNTPRSEAGIYYLEQGATFGCRTSVPPDYTSFIGQITVMYKDAPLDLDRAKAILVIAARMLAETK
jgi:hypothetical protein